MLPRGILGIIVDFSDDLGNVAQINKEFYGIVSLKKEKLMATKKNDGNRFTKLTEVVKYGKATQG